MARRVTRRSRERRGGGGEPRGAGAGAGRARWTGSRGPRAVSGARTSSVHGPLTDATEPESSSAGPSGTSSVSMAAAGEQVAPVGVRVVRQHAGSLESAARARPARGLV